MLIRCGDKFINLGQVCWMEIRTSENGVRKLFISFSDGYVMNLSADETTAFFNSLNAIQSEIAMNQFRMMNQKMGVLNG